LPSYPAATQVAIVRGKAWGRTQDPECHADDAVKTAAAAAEGTSEQGPRAAQAGIG